MRFAAWTTCPKRPGPDRTADGKGHALRCSLVLAAMVSALLIFVLPVQMSASPASGDMNERCRQGADYMIKEAEQAVADPSSRAELRERRRALVNEWKRRLADGEDPCAVYADIQRAATSF